MSTSELVERLREGVPFEPRGTFSGKLMFEAAARLDELERENARLQKERDYAVKWGNASVESVQEAMWRYQDALRAVFARLDHPGNADQRVQYFLRWPEIKEARATLAAQEPRP
jgi:hypothetical protein